MFSKLARQSFRAARIHTQQRWKSQRLHIRITSNDPKKHIKTSSPFKFWKAVAAVSSVITTGVILKHLESPSPLQLLDALQEPMQPLFNMDDQPFVDREPFTAAITTCLESRRSGVFVVWAPPDSGKSIYLQRAAQKWQSTGSSNQKRHVRLFSNYSTNENPNCLLQNALHVHDSQDLQIQLGSTDYELAIVFDQFDEAFHGDNELLRNFIVELAAAAKSSKKFRVFIILQSPQKAKTVLGWNGSQKIYLCGEFPGLNTDSLHKLKWTHREGYAFLKGIDGKWTDEEKQLFANAASESGNIDTLIALKKDKTSLNDPDMQAMIKANADAWSSGISVLKNRPLRTDA